MNAYTITDTHTDRTFAVDVDTTTEQVAEWYGQGEEFPAEVVEMIERMTDALTAGQRDGDAEDYLGIKVEQA